jgi:hypothetical protein
MALKETQKVKAPFVGEIDVIAYIKVELVNGSKDYIDASVKTTSSVTGDIISQAAYRFIPSVATGAENFIKQAYLHLKTLPEFADATDV